MILKKRPLLRWCRRLLWCLPLLAAASCIHEETTDEAENTAQTVGVSIRLMMNVGGAGTTRAAVSDEQEGQVDDVYIFFINTGTRRVHSVVKGEVQNITPTTKTFTANLVVAGTGENEFECIVVANIAHEINPVLKVYEGKSYDELQTMLVSPTLTGAIPTGADARFVMWGKAMETVSASRRPQNINVPMLRALARVDIGIGRANTTTETWDGKDADGLDIPFKLEKVYVYKPSGAYAFMPQAAAYNDGGYVVTAPSVAGTPASTPFEYSVETGSNHLLRQIYLPEADIVQGGEGIPGDDNHTSRCAMVVGGAYNGHPTTYYRIDFNNNTNPRRLINLLRNHCYRMSITAAAGDGETTPDEAYTSRRVNLSVEIVPWEEFSQDIIFDGVDWAHIEKKSIILPGNKGLQGVLAMSSSVKPASWEMSFDGGINYTKDATLANACFSVTKPATAEGGSLLIKTLTEMKPDDPERTSVLSIRIGRLKFDINIAQHPDLPQDWENGGQHDKEL